MISRRAAQRRRLAEIDSFYEKAERHADQQLAEEARVAKMTVDEYLLSQQANAKLRLMLYIPPDDTPLIKKQEV